MQRREFLKNSLASLPLVAVGATVAAQNVKAGTVPDLAPDSDRPLIPYMPGEDHPTQTRLMKHLQGAIDAIDELLEVHEAHKPNCVVPVKLGYGADSCQFCEFMTYDAKGMLWTLQTLLGVAYGASYGSYPTPD